MSKARQRKDKAAIEGGTFDPLGLKWPTLREEIAGGDLDAAYRVANNLAECLELTLVDATQLHSFCSAFKDHERSGQTRATILRARAKGGEEAGRRVEEAISAWEKYEREEGRQEYKRRLNQFAWEQAGFCWHFYASDPFKRIHPALGR